MGTHITILEAVLVSGISIVLYAFAGAIYDTWFKK